MANIKAKADKESSSSDVKYSFFAGRWQPLHPGHQYIFQESLDLGKNVLICIRDVKPDEKNPYTAEEVKTNIENHYAELIKEERVKVMIIPDICSINYGRGVGYEIIEHVPPKEIGNISATSIRQSMREKGEL